MHTQNNESIHETFQEVGGWEENASTSPVLLAWLKVLEVPIAWVNIWHQACMAHTPLDKSAGGKSLNCLHFFASLTYMLIIIWWS